MKEMTKERLMQIAIAITAEKDINVVLENILTEAMDFVNCDGGTIYVVKPDCLAFHTAITRSKNFFMGKNQGNMTLPPVPFSKNHVCAVCAMDDRRINIPDVYEAEGFDFSGAKKYDEMNAYRTKSMMVLPMEDDRGKVIGVLQLINAMDDNGEIVPFPTEAEETVYALNSLAGVSLRNKKLTEQVTDLLHNFVGVMATAIDTRSPYNANHTKNMAHYGERFIAWLNEQDYDWKFPKEEIDPYIMSIWLHDVGKLVIPLEIMDKPDRMGDRMDAWMHKMDIGTLMNRVAMLEHPESAAEVEALQKKMDEAKELILKSNTAGFLPNETLDAIKEAAGIMVTTADGGQEPLLNADELHAMQIQKGTLTAEEREIIQSHVVHTRRLLDQVHFQGDYEKVPDWASAHHEFLDGSGYPNHEKADTIPKEVRLLTILDVYDALTAEDRPYKPPMPTEKAFGILDAMVGEGKLDAEILQMFKDSEAWKKEEA
jgi:HD-GYP domain-containing protein (c-di-GMP phosphodiesterase class II)